MDPKKTVEPNELMIVNDSPGEECRIAILADNHLEELFTERNASATNVGNIYKGRVTNVEPAIQAAFVDYGEGANGFLHISDLHPKYFPGEERTERVGKKIPRRERPPIQAALRRGDEILVQVLKEGIGTKGPTLTSYLSSPGRLLVMMPSMDRVGVSRKVEDEQKRREMREILDSLDLPDGFGFILRTAGYGKTKTELKRDAAYLMRLWKVMEKRIKGVKAPCELYTESDLLIRTVRDVLRPSIKAIIVDSESGYDRLAMFLRVVSPRSAPKVIRYRRRAPIFHAFDIERQIELIHAREVPLASGGRLVIDQTEALVAIDVNSGRSRSARDSETNAYETNIEATDEICRQLRLRDLGGLIVNDLIDMRFAKHRKQIEERFAQNLKRDRAKATPLPISDFGILEMTRQRMRPSLRKSHFMDCPHCNGHGEIKVPEYVAADAARHIGFLLQYERVNRVEVVCSPRVASVMLSGKRRELVRLEDLTGKRIDVRVSDAIAVDRVDYYAYDERNADIDITKLPPLTPPSLVELEQEHGVVEEPALEIETEDDENARRNRQHGPADAASIGWEDDFDDELEEDEATADQPARTSGDGAMNGAVETDGQPNQGRRGRRRRRRRGGNQQFGAQPNAAGPQSSSADTLPAADVDAWPSPVGQSNPNDASASGGTPSPQQGQGGKRSRRRRGRRRRRGGEHLAHGEDQGHAGQAQNPPSQSSTPQPEGGANDVSESSGSIRVHELAKELQVTSQEVIDRCEPDDAVHPLTNSLATVSSDEAQAIRAMFSAPQVEGSALPQHGGGRSRRRRRRRRGGANGANMQQAMPQTTGGETAIMVMPAQATSPDLDQTTMSNQLLVEPNQTSVEQGGRRRSRRRRRGRKDGQPHAGTGHAQASASSNESSASPQAKPDQPNSAKPPANGGIHSGSKPAPTKKPRRALYRAGRAPVSPAAREGAANQDE